MEYTRHFCRAGTKMNYLTKLALIICACIASAPSYGQESGRIQGVVLEVGSSNRVANANVTNKRTQQTATTNFSGVFEIPVTVGDSLIISKIGYNQVITEIKTLSDILIDLTPGSIQLEEVAIERMSKEAELNDVMRGYRKQGVYYEGKPSALAYVFTPITALYERFGRTPSNARRFRSYMGRELQETEVDRVFNKQFIAGLTGLEGQDLQNFVDWYRPSFEKIEHWAEYDLTQYVMSSFKQFDRDGRPAAPKLPKLAIPPQEK